MYKGNHKKGEIEITKENIVFSNKYARLYNDDVIFPSGEKGLYLRFEWTAPYGVVLFPRNKSGDILLIRNFRHENRSWSWEVPKGFGEIELSPKECAKKELMEETGYRGEHWELVKKIPNGKSFTYIFSTIVEGSPSLSNKEDGEAISGIEFFNKNEMVSLLSDDSIIDPITMYFISSTLLMNK
ncbi:NUDIX hydrolase [Enterovibrio norvegicus]|uniref:NUDIX hydrolase n=1 Tax=Enterovibrio norvegicus TaxID=188144 RepID=UPI000C8168FC|nr:NUDIX hydrolase [Enterovibrio norvegicus]PML75541.1 hypothetical protein BCT69_07025 [Enterovibrio norvegicus]